MSQEVSRVKSLLWPVCMGWSLRGSQGLPGCSPQVGDKPDIPTQQAIFLEHSPAEFNPKHVLSCISKRKKDVF